MGSVGRAGPDQVIKVLDLDSGDILPAEETGGVFVRGPQCMMRYHNNPAETAAILKDGWLETGDVGHLDADGYLFLTGRSKEMINVSGLKVYPRELDEVLNQLPAISECCTLGIADSRSGEAVAACIVLSAGANLTEEKIQHYAGQYLIPYKCPKHVYFLAKIPKTPAGKQDRKALLQLLTKAQYPEILEFSGRVANRSCLPIRRRYPVCEIIKGDAPGRYILVIAFPAGARPCGRIRRHRGLRRKALRARLQPSKSD